MPVTTAARGLLAACHPLPTAFVTAFATAYGALLGLDGGRLVLLAAAVLLGQLSIGWCNDAVDALRDTVAGRRDKPVAGGLVARRTVAVASGVALAACVAASFALGTAPGVVHTVAVLAGWAYDLGLKATPLSGVPYLLAFGLLPAFVSLATWESVQQSFTPGVSIVAPGEEPVDLQRWFTPGLPVGWPPLPLMAGVALLGLAAHFANTVGDAEADAATGVRGLPQRIGPRASLTATAVLVGAAAVVLAVGTSSPGPLVLAVLAVGAATAGGGALLSGASQRGPLAFRLTLLAVALVLAGVLLAAARG